MSAVSETIRLEFVEVASNYGIIFLQYFMDIPSKLLPALTEAADWDDSYVVKDRIRNVKKKVKIKVEI